MKLTIGILVSFAVLYGCQSNSTEPPKVAVASPAPTVDSLPSDLKNEAFDYYGLASKTPLRYTMEIPQAKKKGDQASVFQLKRFSNGRAEFEENDSGAITGNSTLTLSLEKEGLFVQSIDPQTLKTPHYMELPAKLTKGFTWSSEQDVSGTTGTTNLKVDYVIVGPGKVALPKGSVEAMEVKGTGAGTLNGSRATMAVDSWFEKGVGLVKQTATIKAKGTNYVVTQTLEQ